MDFGINNNNNNNNKKNNDNNNNNNNNNNKNNNKPVVKLEPGAGDELGNLFNLGGAKFGSSVAINNRNDIVVGAYRSIKVRDGVMYTLLNSRLHSVLQSRWETFSRARTSLLSSGGRGSRVTG